MAIYRSNVMDCRSGGVLHCLDSPEGMAIYCCCMKRLLATPFTDYNCPFSPAFNCCCVSVY